ncbi:MAG: hypothetical protein ABJP45_10945, partial [Cyclobacteriaceae bacterium]
SYLAGSTAIADFRPADQYVEVYALLKEQLTGYQAEMDQLMNGAFAEFISTLNENGVDPVVRKE